MEAWKDIPGYEGRYQISNIGRVKSLPKKMGSYIRGTEIILKKNTNRWGYDYYTFSKPGCKPKSKTVHQMMAIAFIPNPEAKLFVNHINGVKDDNRLENLEWVTAKENSEHAIKSGLSGSVGETNHNAKLTTSQVLEIVSDGRDVDELAVAYNTSRFNIIDIKRGRRWSSVTGLYYKPNKRA
jgi:hypothetical protein